MGIPVWFQIWCFNKAFAASAGAINNKYVNNIGSAPVVEDPGPGAKHKMVQLSRPGLWIRIHFMRIRIQVQV